MGKKLWSTKKVCFLLVILVVLKIGIGFFYENDYFSIEKLNYLSKTITMNQIETVELEALIDSNPNEILMVYFGRDTCPYCVENITKVKKIFDIYEQSAQVKMYYLDTKKNNDYSTQKLKENLGIEYVPTIVVLKDDKKMLFGSEEFVLSDYEVAFEKKFLESFIE